MPLDENARALLGSRLLAARRDAKLSVAEVAEAMGTSPETIRQYQRGHRVPTLDTLADLARVLQTTPAQLLDGVR